MNYSIVIPSRLQANLDHCLGSLNCCQGRIIVAWDTSAGAVPLDQQEEGVEYRYVEAPFIYAKSCNRGISYSQPGAGEPTPVILMNDDAGLLTYGGFDLLHGIARAYPQFGAIAPVVRGQVGQAQQVRRGGDGLPLIREADPGTWLNFVCVYLTPTGLDALQNSGGERGHWLDQRFGGSVRCGCDIERDGEFMPYCRECRGTGTAVVYGGDDVDACLRIQKAGLKIGITDHVLVSHGENLKDGVFRGGVRSTFRSEEDGTYRRVGVMASNEIFKSKWGHYPGGNK